MSGGTAPPFLTSTLNRGVWSDYLDVMRRKNLLPLPAIESRFLGSPASRLAAIPIEISRLLILWKGRAIAQAVSRRLPTAAARVQTRIWSCGIL
jgi:hypothetical protein